MGGADGATTKEIVVMRPVGMTHRVMTSPDHHRVTLAPSQRNFSYSRGQQSTPIRQYGRCQAGLRDGTKAPIYIH